MLVTLKMRINTSLQRQRPCFSGQSSSLSAYSFIGTIFHIRNCPKIVNFTSSADLSKFFYDTLGFVCYTYIQKGLQSKRRDKQNSELCEANFKFYRNMEATSSLAQNLMLLTKSSSVLIA